MNCNVDRAVRRNKLFCIRIEPYHECTLLKDAGPEINTTLPFCECTFYASPWPWHDQSMQKWDSTARKARLMQMLVSIKNRRKNDGGG